jgi:pimeloyl-ACP methyl ester carboxylesterase
MSEVATTRGVFDNTMAYLRWGDGPKTALFVPGGPGNTLPEGPVRRVGRPLTRALVEAGYSVWMVTRPRNLPDGHSIEDMAEDYAALIRAEFGGRVDIALGTSMGGMILQYLAADHPECAGAFVVGAAACEVSEWGKALTRRDAAAVASGDRTERGLTMAEALLPGGGTAWLRRALVPVTARMWDWMYGPGEHEYFEHDFAVEADAALAFDSRAALTRVRVPVLLINGDRDRYFPKDLIEETASLIPDCTLVWLHGKGHDEVCRGLRLAQMTLDYTNRPSAGTGAA